MGLYYVPKVWVSDSDDTDCKECGIRFFAECEKCKKITCTWCAFAADEGDRVASGHVCVECQKAGKS